MTLPASTKTVLGKKLPSQGIGGISPEFVSEFSIGDYRVGGKVSSFNNALNFSRTGTATYTDSTGTLQTAADGVPRTDHHIWNGSAWVNEGLLFESDAATNLLTYSEQFDNAAWADTNAVGVVDRLTANAGTHSAYCEQVISSAPATTLTLSFIFHSTSGRHGYVWIGDRGITGIASATFNLDAVSVIGNNVAATPSISTLADGFVRCSITYTRPTVGTSSPQFALAGPSHTSDRPSLTWAGGEFLDVKAQLETGPIPTSYIKTEATTATRNAETLTASAGDLPYNLTAVSIQMEGTVSYADEGAFSQLGFLDWIADANNEITIRLDTNGTDTGQVRFSQTEAGVFDTLTGPFNSYTPGINVPFNIASRHGSTFLNGAVDGTALTANTTPTALPDLTATDLEIAPNFNGTIKLLRIWGADIGDTGIAQASD